MANNTVGWLYTLLESVDLLKVDITGFLTKQLGLFTGSWMAMSTAELLFTKLGDYPCGSLHTM